MSIPEAILEQIVGIVEEMRNNGLISAASEEILRGLIRKQDGRVISAFKVYVQVKDGADLIDSLLRIAAYEMAQHNVQSSKGAASAKGAFNTWELRVPVFLSNRRIANDQVDEEDEEEEEQEEEEEEGDEDVEQERQEENEDGNSRSNADGAVLSAGDQKTVVQILLRLPLI